MQIAFSVGEEEKNNKQAAKCLQQTHSSGLSGGLLVQTACAYQCSDCGEVAYSRSAMNERVECSYVLGLALSSSAPKRLQEMVDESKPLGRCWSTDAPIIVTEPTTG